MPNVENYYITARLVANYSGLRRNDLSSSRRTLNEIRDLLNTEISGLERIGPYDRKHHIVGNQYIHFPVLHGVHYRVGDTYYRTNLSNVYINDIHLSEFGKDGEYSFGKLEGIVTATIKKPISETALPGILATEINSEMVMRTFVNNSSGQLTSIDSDSGRPAGIAQDKGKQIIRKRYFSGTNFFEWFWIALAVLLLIVFRSVLWPLLVVGAGIFVLWLLIGAFRSLGGIIFGAIAMLALFAWLVTKIGASPRHTNAKKADRIEETTEIRTDSSRGTKSKDSILIVHHRIWNDYDGHTYEADLRIRQSDYFASKSFHALLPEAGYTDEDNFWKNVYGQLNNFDADKLSGTYQVFDSIRQANHMDGIAFAKMVVSCIQDIPYVLITAQDCEKYKLENPQDIPIIEQTSCFGPVKFGVQSPNEFLYTLKGDCDSRTLLCYTVLSHYQYKVAILNSTQYRHSVLGIGLAASGTFKNYQGDRYYLWETTAKNCLPGFVAPDYNNLAFWNFILISNN